MLAMATDLAPVFDKKVRDRTGRSLELYVSDLRERGDSYATIAYDLRNLVGRPVSDEAVRQWCRRWGIE